MTKLIISIDAETDGLWGQPFALAAIVYQDGAEIDKFVLRTNERVRNQWVIDNVVPALSEIEIVETYPEMLRRFALFYNKYRQKGADVICHMGYIVEAYLLRELRRMEFIGEWDAPYPLYDVSGNLQAAGEDPTSVESYAKKHSLTISDYGSTHNPLYDCEVAAKVYMHLTKKPELPPVPA